jgi:hypothetical protein
MVITTEQLGPAHPSMVLICTFYPIRIYLDLMNSRLLLVYILQFARTNNFQQGHVSCNNWRKYLANQPDDPFALVGFSVSRSIPPRIPSTNRQLTIIYQLYHIIYQFLVL